MIRQTRIVLSTIAAAALALAQAPFAAAAPPFAGASSSPKIDDLPLTEIAATGHPGGTFVLLLTGDGGYSSIDREIASAFKTEGQPVVVLNSMKYFWKERTPQGIAADIERIAEHYLSKWRKQKVILVGYSQGADVLPFAVNRMTAVGVQRTSELVLLGLAESAVFEFKVMNWLKDPEGTPILPELSKIRAFPVTCIYGEEEDTSLCPKLPSGGVARVIKLPGGHHFDGDYETVAREVLSAVKARSR